LPSPNSAHASDAIIEVKSLRTAPPTARLSGQWILEKNGSPILSALNRRRPDGRQKLTSHGLGRGQVTVPLAVSQHQRNYAGELCADADRLGGMLPESVTPQYYEHASDHGRTGKPP
jgi:hypothetical protein